MCPQMKLAHSYTDLLKLLEGESTVVSLHSFVKINPVLTHDVINHEELHNGGMISGVVAGGLT
jgi:hypothetical protein